MRLAFFIGFIFSMLGTALVGQGLVINEWLADNENNIVDEDGDRVDWIEIYNGQTTAINLSGYGLSDSEEEVTWHFPSLIIEPASFVLVFASGKNRTDPEDLHTDFKIKASGEVIYLTDAFGVLIDSTPLTSIEEDESFGRFPDGGADWVRFSLPSPGYSNAENNQITLSQRAGYYDAPFYQNIHSLNGDTVYYTIDGSRPTPDQAIANDSVFITHRSEDQVRISDFPSTPSQELIANHAWQQPVQFHPSAVTYRWASYREGKLTSKILTQTYFLGEELGDTNLPSLSIVTTPDNLISQSKGLFVLGDYYETSNPECTGNYFERGEEWERPVHFEYFTVEGELVLTQDGGIRIHGGKTRQAAQKSLRLYARREYGKPSFEYPFFSQKEIDEYETITLRTTMAAWDRSQSIINDIVAHEIVRGLDFDIQDYQPVRVFVNGEYWGIQTLRDRFDADYISYTHGLHKDSLETDQWASPHYCALLNYIVDNDLASVDNYEYISTQMDIDSYIDYYIAEMFFANFDWPANNIKLWRPKSDEGRWRWQFFDIDAGFRDPEYNMFEHTTSTDTTCLLYTSPSPRDRG